MTHLDLDDSKFGRSPSEHAEFRNYTGGRVDLLMRALDAQPETEPVDASRRASTRGSGEEQQSPIGERLVLIDPANR